jgi:DNA invertase Pin-like site-specific DNA recombinase
MSAVLPATTKQQVIAYYRRSTDNRQVYSIERQKEYVEAFCSQNNLEIISAVVETFTGKTMDRRGWKQVVEMARRSGFPIIVKSLSRLGRDAAAVIGTLNKEKVIVADKGMECDRLTLNLLAVIDQNERERISERTKSGLQRAKANGVVLGGVRGDNFERGAEATKRGANEFALRMAQIIAPLRENGVSFGGIADTLNANEMPTRRGGKWTATTVRNILIRWEKMK